MTDELGRVVNISESPRRIVSLAPSVTETLFALGLGERVVAVTSFCDYPLEALEKERVGDTMRPSVERIVALNPDLVIASTASQLEAFVRKLDELAIPVYVTSPRTVNGVMESIRRIGNIAGVDEQAEKLIGELKSRVDAVASRVEDRGRPRVLVMLGVEPLITAGGTSFISDLIYRAGGTSISSDERSDYPMFSLETAVARRPEVIFLQAGDVELPARLASSPAARNDRVYRLDDTLLMRPGPRIVDGLEQMAARIHPEAFGNE